MAGYLQMPSLGASIFNTAGAVMANGLENKANLAIMREQNAFSAAEAQKQRDYETEMSNTSYQRAVKDLQAAGLNPALAYQNGGATTPTGAAASPASSARYSLSYFADSLSKNVDRAMNSENNNYKLLSSVVSSASRILSNFAPRFGSTNKIGFGE